MGNRFEVVRTLAYAGPSDLWSWRTTVQWSSMTSWKGTTIKRRQIPPQKKLGGSNWREMAATKKPRKTKWADINEQHKCAVISKPKLERILIFTSVPGNSNTIEKILLMTPLGAVKCTIQKKWLTSTIHLSYSLILAANVSWSTQRERHVLKCQWFQYFKVHQWKEE